MTLFVSCDCIRLDITQKKMKLHLQPCPVTEWSHLIVCGFTQTPRDLKDVQCSMVVPNTQQVLLRCKHKNNIMETGPLRSPHKAE